jgi:hypothetical protein
VGGAVKPAAQDRVTGKGAGLSGEGEERALDNVFGKLWITQQPKGGRVDGIDMASNQFIESAFRVVLEIQAEEFLVSAIVHRSWFHLENAATAKKRTGFMADERVCESDQVSGGCAVAGWDGHGFRLDVTNGAATSF